MGALPLVALILMFLTLAARIYAGVAGARNPDTTGRVAQVAWARSASMASTWRHL